MRRPPLALTMGDPAGVGPEVLVRAYAVHQGESCIAIGDPKVLASACEQFAPELSVRELSKLAEACGEPGLLEVLPAGRLAGTLQPGQVRADSGLSGLEAFEEAVRLALEGSVAGIVTAPIHKEAWGLAGSPFAGHTELLAARSGVHDASMMLANDWLRVVLVTVHCSLADVPARITREAVGTAIHRAVLGAEALGVSAPRVAVCGLNPHAGEGGRLGREELDVIAPAIAQARDQGIQVHGPLSADTLFERVRGGEFDVVVAQYHDQGLIPIKTGGFGKGVNVTLGLPFVRTSPDHGTAFDRAWQGEADASSFSAAIELAERLCRGNSRSQAKGLTPNPGQRGWAVSREGGEGWTRAQGSDARGPSGGPDAGLPPGASGWRSP